MISAVYYIRMKDIRGIAVYAAVPKGPFIADNKLRVGHFKMKITKIHVGNNDAIAMYRIAKNMMRRCLAANVGFGQNLGCGKVCYFLM